MYVDVHITGTPQTHGGGTWRWWRCMSRKQRAPPGGCTHGPVIISTGRSQEMHFTRSNSFLEDIQSSALAPQPGPVRPLLPQTMLGGGCRSVCASGPGLPPTSYAHWPGPAQLSCAPADPVCGLLGQRWDGQVCVVYLPAPNIMEDLKIRGLLESYPSWWILGV